MSDTALWIASAIFVLSIISVTILAATAPRLADDDKRGFSDRQIAEMRQREGA